MIEWTLTIPWLRPRFKATPVFMFGLERSCSYNHLLSRPLCSSRTVLYSCHCHNHKAVNNRSCLKRRMKAECEYSPLGEVALHTVQRGSVCVCFPVHSSLCVCARVTELLILDKWQPFWTGPSTRHQLNIYNAHVWANVFLPLPNELQATFSLGEGGRDCGWWQGWNL